MEKENNKEQVNIEEQLDTVAACIKMPVSRKCNCKKNLIYNPSTMKCRKCVMSIRLVHSVFNSELEKAFYYNDLEKTINILSEVK